MSSKCDTACGNGTETWTRKCDNPPAVHKGSNCLSKNSERLVTETETRECYGKCRGRSRVITLIFSWVMVLTLITPYNQGGGKPPFLCYNIRGSLFGNIEYIKPR